MKKDSIYLGLIIMLAAGFVFQICSSPTPEPNTDVWKEAIAEKQIQIDTLEQIAAKHTQKIKNDSLVFLNASQEQQSKVKKLSLNLERLRKNYKVQFVIREVPEIDTVFQAYDSLLAVKDQQLYTANKYIQTLQVDLGQAQVNFNERLNLEKGKYQDQQSILTAVEEDNKKAKRKTKFWKAAAVVLGAGGLFLGSQL